MASNLFDWASSFLTLIPFLARYLILYLPAFWILSRLIKNIWVRWTVVWLLISALDFLASYMRDDYPDSSLSPFEISMTLPGGFAAIAIFPLIILRSELLHFFLILLGQDPYNNELGLSEAWFSGVRGGWLTFLIDFSMDFIICGLIFFLTRLFVAAGQTLWRQMQSHPA